jgi:pimeloyl-ACP methyl ester carboxylesterase
MLTSDHRGGSTVKTNRRLLLLVSSVLILAVLSCEYGHEETPAPTVTPTLVPTATATSTPTPEPAYEATFVPTDCAFEIQAGAVVECGYVVVPEDREGDLNDTIRLAVAIFRSPSGTPAPDPVVFLQGGPGGNAVEISPNIYDIFIAPILEERDVIIFDQRGAGLSEPSRDCDELISVYLLDQMALFPVEEREERYTDALISCRDRLITERVDPLAYTSAASAADVNDIAIALGYEQINLYGFSYGTRLGQVIMRDFPEIVRSAVLDSVVPIDVHLYNESAANAANALDIMFEDCRAQPMCNAAYPDLEIIFYDLVERLEDEPITLDVLHPVLGQSFDYTLDGEGAINLVVWSLHTPDYASLAPQLIYDTHNDDVSLLRNVLVLPIVATQDLNIGTALSLSCQEQILASTPEEIEADLAEHPGFEDLGPISMVGGSDVAFSICEIWETAPYDPLDAEPVVSDIPTLIISGEYDPTTPPRYGAHVAENLSNGFFFEFAGRGHTPSMSWSEDCPMQIALAFLHDPTVEPDSACMAEITPLRFVVPFDGSVEVFFEPHIDEQLGVAGAVPSGWVPIGMGWYNRNSSALDPTQLGIQRDVASPEVWLEWLTGQYASIGLDGPPALVGSHESSGLVWQLYEAEFRGNPVDIALAEGDNMTLLVAMVSLPEEHNAMVDAIFLPVLDSVAPVE